MLLAALALVGLPAYWMAKAARPGGWVTFGLALAVIPLAVVGLVIVAFTAEALVPAVRGPELGFWVFRNFLLVFLYGVGVVLFTRRRQRRPKAGRPAASPLS